MKEHHVVSRCVVCTGESPGCSAPGHDPVYYKPLYVQALDFALQQHRGQVDIHGHDYELHVLRVMAGVSRMGINQEEALAAAALHDVVEDCGVSLGEIAHRFGRVVGDLVDLLTHREGETYRYYIERLANSRIARAIKLSDLEDNSLFWRVVPSGKKQKIYPAAILRLQSGEWPKEFKE